MKFLAKIADVLSNSGHEVTVLQPVIYEYLHDKKVIKNPNVKIIDYHLKTKKSAAENTASMSKLWHTSSGVFPLLAALKTSNMLYTEFEEMCNLMMTDTELHEFLVAQNFDAHISEAFDFCGLYLGNYLKLKSPIPLYSGDRNAPTSDALAEPSPINYQPSHGSTYGPDSSVSDRLNDLITTFSSYYTFGQMFDLQFKQVDRLTGGGKVQHWRDILTDATFFLVNSNPYLSFVTPTIPKIIPIGGFTVDPPKSLKLSPEFENVLSLRNSAILVSFGTVIQSADMPENFKSGLIQAFRSLPDVTFIWKYENLQDEELKSRLPENVHLSKWVPQPALLADPRLKIFVTHGGLSSVLEIAYTGTPSITIPVFSDQGDNAQMLARHGGSLVFDKSDLENSEKLVRMFEKMLGSPDFREKAENLAEILRNPPLDPKLVLLKHCEFSAKFGKIQNLQPYTNKLSIYQYYHLDFIFFALIFVICVVVFVKFFLSLVSKKLKLE